MAGIYEDDEYRQNYGVGNSTGLTQRPWLWEFAGADHLHSMIAATDLGLGANLRAPLWPVDTAGFPVRLSGDLTVDAMVPADYKNYWGILYNSGRAGTAVPILRGSGSIVRLPVGSADVLAGDIVMCESDLSGLGTDVIPLVAEAEGFVHVLDDAYTANDPLTIGMPIESISSAKLKLTGALASPLIVITTGSPTAGQIKLLSSTSIELGSSYADGDEIHLYAATDVQITNYAVGRALEGGVARTPTVENLILIATM